ncbi:hypothetical protein [Phycicoccus flavus]|uniref:hypothetical protein n=1 Tax=Phycicoccus flavus TaxID=2502783 RepID=UPI000FEBE736|nr:hypothetical protein [Phycicoccus flavus]NHA68759.1 hypothetical protein [Phycicoccus flavus]
MTTSDTRSVGELLLACDRDTRALLLDPHDLDAAALVRAWPEMVQAAHELLSALPTSLPHPGRATQPGPADVIAERLRMASDGTHRHLAARTWPGTGPSDSRLIGVADAFVRAHDLIHATWRGLEPGRVDVLVDATAARARVLHSVYVATHAVGLAVGQEIRDREHGPATRSRHATHRLAALRYTRDRLQVAERITGTELYRVFPHALTGEHRDPPAAGRVATVLARWDLEAHRALATHPGLPTLFEVTRIQAATTAMTHRIMAAAASQGDLDALTFQEQLDAQLAAATSAWQILHTDLRDLTPPTARAIPDALHAAGGEVVAALAEIVIDGTALASTATIVDRSSPETLHAAAETLAASHDLAITVLDTVADGSLTVSARAAQAYLTHQQGPTVSESPTRTWIDPRDLTAHRTIPLPPPVAVCLQRHASYVPNVTGGLAAAALPVRDLHPPGTEEPRPPHWYGNHDAPRSTPAAYVAP